MRQYLRKACGCVTALALALSVQGINDAIAEVALKAPKLKVDSDSYNFGAVAEGTKVKYDFKIKNVGTSDLAIQRVIPSCGCTNSKAIPETLASGGEGVIHVEFDTSGFAGDKTKIVRVLTNDSENPSVTLTVRGRVEEGVSVVPPRVSFESIVRGTENAQEVTISVKGDSESKIASIKSFSKNIRVEEISHSDKEKKVRISIAPEAPVGELRDRVLVALTGSRTKTVNIPVYAFVTGELSLVPSAVSFGIIEGTEPIERVVKFDNAGKSAVSVKEISSDNPAVTAALTEIQKGKRYVIKVKVDPARVKESLDLRALVTVVTDKESLLLNVYGTVPPKA